MTRTVSLITKAHNGDKSSEEILVNENLPLVHSCVKKLCHENSEYEDLLQLGTIGLVKAIRRFDVTYNVQFSTYAVPLIMGEIRRFLRDDGIIKVSRSLKEIKQKACIAQSELLLKKGYEPGVGEIADYINEKPEKLVMALEACAPCDSLERPIEIGQNGDIKLADTIADSMSFGDELERIALKSALTTLGPRERKIIVLRYFKGKTQAEVSRLVGVSQVQVSRIEKRILASLRKSLE